METSCPKTRLRSALPLILAFSAVGLASCELLGDTSLPDYANLEDISYVQHVQVLFDDRCTACHGAGGALPDLTSLDGLRSGASTGGAVVPFSAERSRLIRMLATRTGATHPENVGGERLPDEEVDFLRRWIDGGARDDLGQPLYADAQNLVLATLPDEALIALIDADRMAVARYIDIVALGFSPNARPTHVAAVPGGSGWVVSLPGEGAVLRFDAGHTLRGLAEIVRPGPLAASQDGAWFVVGRQSDDPADLVHVIEASAMRVTELQTAFSHMEAVAIRPQGDVAFAASRQSDQLVVIPTGSSQTTFTGVGGPRHGIVELLTPPGGSKLFALGSSSGQLVEFDLSSPAQPVQTRSVTVGGTIRAGALLDSRVAILTQSGSIHIVDPDGSSVGSALPAISSGSTITTVSGGVWVGGLVDGGGQRFTDITVIGGISVTDPGTSAIVRTIEIDGVPAGMATLSLAAPTTSGSP
ncbi:MAG: hypothetical protein HKN29_01695 [Rhodothermales bacterium]|nr:hypothetical protein [Rhodothermales bacterium]